MNLDMKTAGLSIICEILKSFKKKLPIINLMRNNFDGFVDTIKKYYQKDGVLDRRCIKRLIYNFIGRDNFQFSDWVDYLKNKNIFIKNIKKIHPLIRSYIKEITFVKKVIYENNTQLALYLKNKKIFDVLGTKKEISNKKCSLFLVWVEIIETEIVFNMYNFLKKEKIIKNNYCTMFGDAIVFPYIERDKDEVLKKVNKYIKIKTGFTFHIDLKLLEEEEFIIEDIIDERKQCENDDDEDEDEEDEDDDDDDEDDDDEDDDDEDDDDEDDDDEDDEEDDDEEDEDDDDDEEDDDDDDEEEDDDET
jgi:hypothetical protein